MSSLCIIWRTLVTSLSLMARTSSLLVSVSLGLAGLSKIPGHTTGDAGAVRSSGLGEGGTSSSLQLRT
jgi:hypothetical protein